MSLGFIVSLINPAINATSAICCSVIADGAAIHVKSNIIIIRSIRYLGICTASHQTYTAAKGAAFTATHSGNILRNLSSVHNECAIFINSNTAPQGIAVARAICSACDFGVICICYSIIFYRGTLVHCQCAAIDGDTSTNDTCVLMANGMAGNVEITEKGEAYALFVEALSALCVKLARQMARDGEGAKHLITCTVSGARDEQSAETVAKSVIASSLTKAAVFGCDANWGRVLCAMGYSGESFDPERVDVTFSSENGAVDVCRAGRGLPFDEALARQVLSAGEVVIAVSMGEGDGCCTCWGCDLTYDYVQINGDYRT